MRRTLTVLSMTVTVLGLAGLATAADTMKAEGEVVLMTPAVIQMSVDGTITSFERTSQSQVDPGVHQGERAVIWYEKVGESMRVTSMSVSHSNGSTAADSMADESGSQGMAGNRTQSDQSDRSQNRNQQMNRNQQNQQMNQSDTDNVGTEQDLSYEEYQRQSRERMNERHELPQTATHTRELGLTGLLLLLTGAGLALRSTRS